MAGQRLPGPLGTSEAETTLDDSPGVLGHGIPRGPVGTAVTLDDTAPAQAPTAAPSTGIELNLCGSFPKPPTWTAAKEKAQIAAGKWFPHSADFQAVAGKGSLVTTSVWDFLVKIVQAKGQISRLNLFSHSTTGLIVVEGTVLDDGSNVLLGNNQDGGWTQIFGKSKAICDPYAKTWGTLGENSGTVSVTVGSANLTLDQVRAKFAKDAEIWLYLCHGASDPLLFQQFANAFQVTTKGFTKEVLYCAPANFPVDRKHRVGLLGAVGPTPTPAELAAACQNAVSDFRQLATKVNASDVRTASPKQP